jgi:site-specific recombinase XerD
VSSAVIAGSVIVELGLDVVRVQKALGHSKSSITLDTYSHLFELAQHAEDLRTRMQESAFGRVLESV